MVAVWYNYWIEYRISWINHYWSCYRMYEILEICHDEVQVKETKPGS